MCKSTAPIPYGLALNETIIAFVASNAPTSDCPAVIPYSFDTYLSQQILNWNSFVTDHKVVLILMKVRLSIKLLTS